LRDSIIAIARRTTGIERAHIVFTVHLAPDQVVAVLSLEFNDRLTTPEIERAIDGLEHDIHQAHPEVIAVFVKPQADVLEPRWPVRVPGGRRRLSDLKRGSATSSAR
jgi:divalent metal cation (Fe/Co/Zn/Cd) transporter